MVSASATSSVSPRQMSQAPQDGRRHPGVVGAHRVALLAELFAERVDFAPADAVDDPRLALVPLEHLDDLLRFVAPLQDAIDEVGPVEIADEQERIAQRELF